MPRVARPQDRQGLKEPQQDRSRRTLERMLDAAVDLMNEGTFEKARVTEVVRRAGCSVGAFYARFSGKEALFLAAQDHFFGRLEHVIEGLTDARRWEGRTLEYRVRGVLNEVLKMFQKHAGILGATSLHLRSRNDVESLARGRKFNRAAWSRIGSVFLACRSEMSHPDPDQAVAVALSFTFSAMRERIVFRKTELVPLQISNRAFVEELIRACLSYLQVGPQRAPQENARKKGRSR